MFPVPSLLPLENLQEHFTFKFLIFYFTFWQYLWSWENIFSVFFCVEGFQGVHFWCWFGPWRLWNRQAWELPGGGYFKIIIMHDHPHWKVKIIHRLEYPTNPSVLLTCLPSCDSSSNFWFSIGIMYCVNITNLKYNSSKRPVNCNSSRAQCTIKFYIFSFPFI